MSSADEEAPFSEQILRWLDEGDKLGEAPPDGARGPSTASTASNLPSLRAPSRGLITRDRTLIIGAGLVGVVVVIVLRLALASSHRSEETAAAPSSAPGTRVASAASTVPSVTMGMPTITMKRKVAPAAVTHPPEPAAPAAAPAPVAATVQSPPAPAAAPAPAPAPVQAAAPPAPAPAAPAPAAAPASPPAAPVVVASAAVAASPPAAAAPPPAAHPMPMPPPAAAAAAPAAAPAASASDTFESDVSSCRAALTAGKIKNAVTACQHAIEARPTAPAPLTLLAEAEFSRGRGREALRLANAAVASDPRFADAYVIIGGVQQDLGHREEAFAAYRRYLTLAPRGSHAGELRALLASR